MAYFNRKEYLRHRAVSLRQHGFLVVLAITCKVYFGKALHRDSGSSIEIRVCYTRVREICAAFYAVAVSQVFVHIVHRTQYDLDRAVVYWESHAHTVV